jgi:hypothetical protein
MIGSLTAQPQTQRTGRHAARLALAALATASLALVGSAQAAKIVSCTSKSALAGHTCGATSGPLEATMVPSTHYPKIKAKWPLLVTATLNGKPARASAVYQFLFGGVVVSTQYPTYNKHFMFTGHFSDNLIFPPPSYLQVLTLQVVIKSGGHTVNLDWAITPGKK